jgi:selenocysteine lyase/cysteine desulfurase
MDLSRRAALLGAGFAPILAIAGRSEAASPAGDFGFTGTYINAAYVHPLPRVAFEAGEAYQRARLTDPMAVDPRRNARNAAVSKFAVLIGAQPEDIAVVASTLVGENMVVEALSLKPGDGILTDGGHYDGTLALYDHMAKQGTPVAVVKPRDGRIDLADVKALLTPKTKLVAVSLVSSPSGFLYDLTELCALAHSKGALVYADIVQAAGALPIDVKASGVDFACAGSYKWLMGDFGAAFLYVRPDRLDRLKRTEVGWRTIKKAVGHALPFEAPGPTIGDYELNTGAQGLFEISTPAWGCLATVAAGMDYIVSKGGPAALAAARRPLTDRLHEALPRLGLLPLGGPASASPSVVFAGENLPARFAQKLKDADIRVTISQGTRMRISPSVYNTMDDINHLISVLSA